MEKKSFFSKKIIYSLLIYLLVLVFFFSKFNSYKLTVDEVDAKICFSNRQIISLSEDIHYITQLSHTASYRHSLVITDSNYLLTHGLIRDKHIKCPSSDFYMFWVDEQTEGKEAVCLVHSPLFLSRDEFISDATQLWITHYVNFRMNTVSSKNDMIHIDEMQFDDKIRGKSGNDIIYDMDIGKVIEGGIGNDLIIGKDGANTIDGGSGTDIIFGGIGNDTINGGTGNDILFGDNGYNTINGGLGTDIAYFDGYFKTYYIKKTGTMKYTVARTNQTSSDELSSIEIIKFSDGTSIDLREYNED